MIMAKQKMDNKKQKGKLITALVLSVMFLSACNTKTPEELVLKAKLHHTQGNTEVAVIELREILQKNPELVSAMEELNSIYVEKKKYTEIINLLRSPVQKGLSDQGILYPFTDALIHEAKFEEAYSLINRYSEKFMTAQGLALEGHCLAGLNKSAEARESYKQALLLDENLISAHLGLAQEAIIATETNQPKQQPGQQKIQNKHSEWVNKSVSVTSAENNISLKEARLHLQKILSLEPDNTVGNYLTATIFYLEKNTTEMERSLHRVLKEDPEHKESLLLMGKLHLELSHLDQSERFLSKYLKTTPNDLKARMYLASIMLRKHQPDRALMLLEDYSDQGQNDPEYMLILGNSYLALNNNDFAIDNFEKAHAIFPSSTLVKMYSAMGYLARSNTEKNDRDSAIRLLREVLEIEPENKQAGISLITTLLQESDFEGAEKVAENVIKHYPKAPVPWYLRGLSWQGMDNDLKAIEAYKKTLEFNHSFIPATIRLAKIHQNNGEYELAQKQYEAGLYDSPYNAEIMTEMAIYEQKIGNNEKAVEILELARDRNHDSLSPRLLLGTYYLRRGQVNSAQQIMDELNEIEPDRPDVQMYFGQIKLATGRSSEAVSIFSKLIQLKPDSPDLLTKYGSALRMNGETENSRNALKTAWALSERSIPEALIELGKLELAEKNYQDVRTIINDLQSEFPDLAGGYILEGDLEIRQQNPLAAILPFQLARKRNNITSVILKLFNAYSLSGADDKAYALLGDAVQKKPDDLRLGMTFASVKQKSGDHSSAITIYQNLLTKYPENSLILNNLAWVYHKTDRKKALSFAQRAYQVTPDLPQIIDSYGWFCVLDGRIEQGLNLLETAVEKSPADPEYRYHLAEALFISGKKDSARKSLEQALANQERFNGRNEAEELLLKLSREVETTKEL